MKKQANIFSLITIILGALGIFINFVEMILNMVGKRGALNMVKGGEAVITIIVLVLLLAAIPDLIKRALQIVFGLLARNPQGGGKTIINWLGIALIVILPIISSIALRIIPNFLASELFINGSIISAYRAASTGLFASIVNRLADCSLLIASAFAIAEKKTAPRGEYIEEQ